jgi:hypothetical protein
MVSQLLRRQEESMHRMLFLLLAIMGTVIMVAPAFAAEGGTIEGKIVNKTAGGTGSLADLEVTLTTFFGQTERNKATAKTDEEGNFKFTGLDTGSNYSYEAITKFQEVDYTAPRVSFSGGGETKQVELTVYESTTDEGVVRASAKHYVLYPGNGQLEVTEIVILSNTSDRSYIGSREVGPGQRATSRYEPPAGATAITYDNQGLMSCCVVKDGAGFVDTMPIRPGGDQKAFTYQLPYGGSDLSFSTTLQQPVDRVQLLVPSGGIRATVTGLASHGTQNIQGTIYQVFSGESLPTNTTLRVDLEGLPSAPFGDSPLVVGGIALATLSGLGGAFYVLRRRTQLAPLPDPSFAAAPLKRRQSGQSRPVSTAAMNPALLDLEKQELLIAMANLDDWFEEGRISKRDYQRLRADKKDRLLALVGHTNGTRTPSRV